LVQEAALDDRLVEEAARKKDEMRRALETR
jgi:hypothetical protein